ncbi:MAG: hypothetical protein HW378_772 [Anaerolineales bacterium]|nr:hypothetical protein [Anaerolineales bacterium]
MIHGRGGGMALNALPGRASIAAIRVAVCAGDGGMAAREREEIVRAGGGVGRKGNRVRRDEDGRGRRGRSRADAHVRGEAQAQVHDAGHAAVVGPGVGGVDAVQQSLCLGQRIGVHIRVGRRNDGQALQNILKSQGQRGQACQQGSPILRRGRVYGQHRLIHGLIEIVQGDEFVFGPDPGLEVAEAALDQIQKAFGQFGLVGDKKQARLLDAVLKREERVAGMEGREQRQGGHRAPGNEEQDDQNGEHPAESSEHHAGLPF